MFNNTTSYHAGDVTNTLKINACSGGIYKTYKESWFERFNLNSEKADKLFNNCAMYNVRTGEFHNHYYEYNHSYGGPNYDKPKNETKEVIILQMVICGDMEVIAEIIKKDDFEKYFDKINIEEKNPFGSTNLDIIQKGEKKKG